MTKAFKFKILLGVFCAAGVGSAIGQTQLNTSRPGNSNARIDAAQTVMSDQQNAVIPQSVLNQAARQHAGDYGRMTRPAVAAGQIQEAWDKAGNEQGVHEQVECGSCVYRVVLREFMGTALEFPRGVVIEKAILGDGVQFELQETNTNRLIVRPLASGVDTSLQVYAEDGRIFTFYLRGEGVQSKNVPDLLFRILPPRIDAAGYFDFKTLEEQGVLTPPLAQSIPEPGAGPAAGQTDNADFVKSVPFDPSRVRGFEDYSLWGARDLKPVRVFRDDYFTYLQYGDKWAGLELPTAYVVNDEIDELVNTRVVGDTYIIESVNPLITLKSGQKYMCIKYSGD